MRKIELFVKRANIKIKIKEKNILPPNTKSERINKTNNKNRSLTLGISNNCGKTYLMNHILLQKQEPVFLSTKSLNQYPNINAQTSDEIQPLHEYENNIVVFDDMLLSKQESNIDLFLTNGRHNIVDIYSISQS